jgi:NTE family protein
MAEQKVDEQKVDDEKVEEKVDDEKVDDENNSVEEKDVEVVDNEKNSVEVIDEKSKITELCLAGACNRGVCYIGSIKKLEELEILDIKTIVGVSIGGFIAVCYILGYTPTEMLDIIIQKDTKDFKDISLTEAQGAILKGNEYRKWIREVISEKVNPDITLSDLYKLTKINLIMNTTCIYSVDPKYPEGMVHMSHVHTPDMPLIVAINSTMSFPFIFPPIIYEGNHFIDGGVLDNFPLDQVSKNALGLRVNFSPIDGLTSTKSPISYIGKLFELISSRLKYLSPGSSDNIVCIECEDFGLVDFEMSIDDKITLYKRGYQAIEDFLDKRQ